MNVEEFYRWYNPNTDTYGEKYTWKQLLYSFYEEIASEQKPTRHYNWRLKRYEEPEVKINSHDCYLMNGLFHKIGHTNKDGWWELSDRGKWVTEWRWVTEAELDPHSPEGDPVLIEKQVLKPYQKYVRLPSTWKYYSRIIDSNGRTISSGYLKHQYKLYRPNINDKKPEPIRKVFIHHRGWWYSVKSPNVIINGYKFRQGPVPGIGRRRKWNMPKCTHGGTHGEASRYDMDRILNKEIFDEYGVKFKLRSKRNAYELDRWNWGDRHYIGKRGYGWKRTKKEKQWM